MPPKPKEAPINRPAISDSSLLYVPDDVVDGFQERIESGIDWNNIELAVRHHRNIYQREDLPEVPFTKALQWKIQNSVFNGFFDSNSTMSMREHWELIMPIAFWDNKKFANEEENICFQNTNFITDNMIELLKKSVLRNSREELKRNFEMMSVLRLINSKMSCLDRDLKKFKQLVSLILCGNHIEDIDPSCIPESLRSLELQMNMIISLDGFAGELPAELLYLGLSKNQISDGTVQSLSRLPIMLRVLDVSDNDIYDLEQTLQALAELPNLTSLQLAGNPCSFCAAYAKLTIDRLPNLHWLDLREVLETDRSDERYEPHPSDLRSAFFVFNVLRIISTPQPPKPEKGIVTSFCVELELPLLDSTRRKFLLYRQCESLIETIAEPPCEDDELQSNPKVPSIASGSKAVEAETSTHESDIYKHLKRKNSKIIYNYTTYKSNPVQWNKLMTFQNPVVKIFIPDLRALKNTFHSVVTVRFVYNMTITAKSGKDKKSDHGILMPGQSEVVLATVRCSLKNPDWSQSSQHFHWDNTLDTDDAIHWGQGDLSVIQYSDNKPQTKGKQDTASSFRQTTPENLTCHFSFGIDTIQV